MISRAEAVHQCSGIHPSAVSRSFARLGHHFAQAYPRPLEVDKANPGLLGWRLPTAALRDSEMSVMVIKYRKAAITRQDQWGHRINGVTGSIGSGLVITHCLIARPDPMLLV